MRNLLASQEAGAHTTMAYLLLMKGDASLARSGWLAMIRAEEAIVSAGVEQSSQEYHTMRS